MPSLSEFKANSKIKAIVVSKPKVGKTVGAATFPRPNFISFDHEGLTSLVNPEMEAKYGFSKRGIVYEVFKDDLDSRGVVTAHKALDNACKYFDRYMAKGLVDTFDTWVIDSGSTLISASSNKAVILGDGGTAVPGYKSSTWKTARTTGLMHLKIQDMGAERSMTEQFIKMVRETDKHVLVLCHEREVWEGEGDNAKLVAITPLFTGQSVEKIPADFNEVWWVEAKPKGTEMLRVLQTSPRFKRIAGSRLGVPDETVFEYEAIAKALKLPSGKAQVPA